MAENRVPYIIDLTVSDKDLRTKMSKWDWEEILGSSKGKSFKQVLTQDTEAAAKEIKSTLGGLGLDWGKILGEKELKQLETKIGHVIKANKDKLSVFASDGDISGLQKTIDLVSALGNELKGLGSDFDASGIARNINAFMKVLTPLSAKIEALAKEPAKVEAAFDRLFSSNKSNGVVETSAGFTLLADGIKGAGEQAKHYSKDIEQLQGKLSALSKTDATIKISTKDISKQFNNVVTEVEKVEDKIETLRDKLTRGVDSLSVDDYNKTAIDLANAYAKRAELYKKMDALDNAHKKTNPDDSLFELEGIIEKPSDVAKEAKEYIQELLSNLQKEFKGTKSTDGAVNIPLKLPSEDELVKLLNGYIDSINKKKSVHKVQIDIDDVANVIEDKSRRAYGENEADDDVNTTKIVEQTENRFDRIATAIQGKQKKILDDTKVWRKDMLDQFKFNSGDFEFKFNDALIESLQSLFDDYALKVNIDPQHLADQITTVLNSNGGTMGGTANIDAGSMASAIALGLRAALTGEIPQIAVDSSGSDDEGETISQQVTHVATEIEQTAKHLDLAEDYVKDVVAKLKAVAKYASKDSAGSVATKDVFSRLGIDLSKVKTAGDVGNDAEIVKMLETAFLQRDEFGSLTGSTLINRLTDFKGSSSKTIPAFLTSMGEVFIMLQEDTQTVDEWTRKRESKEIFDSAREKAKAASALRDVRSPIRQGEIPNVQSIEKAIALMTALGKNTDDLETLKAAREALSDKTDDASIAEFKTAADTFYKSTTKTFWDLKKQAEDTFKGIVQFQGKNGKTHSKYIDGYKQIANIKDDAVIVDIQVSSTLSNVALGTTQSKYSKRMSPTEEQRMLRGAAQPGFVVPREYEKDILAREVGYKGFKPQGVSTTQVDLDASFEANQKRKQVLIKEIENKEQEKTALESEIATLDAKIEDLTKKNKAISAGSKKAALEEVADYEATQQQLAHEIFRLEEKVGNEKTGEEEKIGSITKDIEESLRKRASAEQQLASLSEEDVERRKKSISTKILELEKELPNLQKDLTQAQNRQSIAESDRIMAQADVFKAESALKAIPDTKKNATARAEAEKVAQTAKFVLSDAVAKVNETAKDVEAAINAIERNDKQISNLKGQLSETTLESIRQEQLQRIQAIDNAIASLENEFETLMTQKHAKETALAKINKELEKAQNANPLKTQRDLDLAISERDKLTNRERLATTTIQNNKSELERLASTEQRIQAKQEYNKIKEKSLMLQGSIKKLEEDGEPEKKIEKRRKQLQKVNDELAATQTKLQDLGGFFGQQDTKEYSDGERKTYALRELKAIEDDLITARAQKRIAESRISKKDREIEDLDKWGLGAGIGASALGKEKGQATSDFMSGSYVQSQLDALREKTKAAIVEAENESRKIFDKKVAVAMEHLGWNPLDQTQVQKFLNTKQGQQLSNDFASEIDTNTTNIWKQYDEFRQDLLMRLKTDFQNSFKTDKGVFSYTSKIQDETGKWIDEIVEVDVKQALRARLEKEKQILEAHQQPIQDNIGRLEADKATAIEYGGISDKELLSGDIIKDQIRKEEELAKWVEKRAIAQARLNDLEQANVAHSDEDYKTAKKKLTEAEKQVSWYEMLVENRQKLVQMRYDESKEPTYTDEEKQLHFTNQIVTYNQKIEDSLAKQKNLAEQIASATGDEKTKLQRQLFIEEENVAKWREKIPTFENKLNRLHSVKSQATTSALLPEGGIVGSIVSAIQEAMGGIGAGVEINTEALAQEATLRAILEVLGGVPSGLNRGTDGLGRGKTYANSEEIWKSIPAYKNETSTIDSLRSKAVDLKATLDTLYDESKTDSIDFLKTQTELARVLTLLRNKASKDNPSLYGEKGNKESARQAVEVWKSYLTNGDSKLFDDLNNISLANISKANFNSRFKKLESSATPVTTDQTDTSSPKKTVKKTTKRAETTTSERRQVTGGLIQIVSQLATEDTLLQVLNALQTVGTVEGGKVAPTAAGDLYNQFKALLLGGSIDDHERLAYLNSKDGAISGNVIGNIANISNQLIKELRAKYPAAQGFDTQIHTHGKESKPYFSKEDYQHFTKDYESGIKKQVLLTKDHIAVLDLTAVKSAEEVQALMDELIKAGNNAKAIKNVFANNKSGAVYESAKFDNLNANSLVKMLGATGVTSGDATSEIDTLVSKLQSVRQKMQQAMEVGYLSDADDNLVAFDKILKRTNEIADNIQKGATSYEAQKAELDELANSAKRYSDIIGSTIGANKRAYVGTTEVNVVNKQRNQIVSAFGSEEAFLNSNIALVQQYNQKVQELNQTYQNLADNRQLQNNAEKQALSQQALQVTAIGKRLKQSIDEAATLKQAVDKASTYTDKSGNIQSLGGIQDNLSVGNVKNLEATMRHYVQNTLKQANIENVKFNNTQQQLTYTFRISKDTVADMVVKYNDATNALYVYNIQERESLTGWPALVKGIKAKMASIGEYIFSITSITRIWGEIKRGVQYIQEIDSALTELKKVTDETVESYDRFLNSAAKTADRIGSTIKEIVSSTADWSRLGYTMKDAANLAESTAILLNVSEFQSIEDATSALTSTLQAFGYTANQSMGVVDVLNEVGKLVARR